MDLTMLRTIVRRQRFLAYCQSVRQRADTKLSSILQTLVPHEATIPTACTQSPTPEEIEMLYETHGDLVPFEIYNTLLVYVNANTTDSEQFRHCADLPHTGRVLPQIAIRRKWFTHWTWLFGSRSLNPGNSCISFWTSSGVASGEIVGIWSHFLNGVMRDFFVVSPHSRLSDEDSARNPYNSFPGFQCTVVYQQLANQIIIIEPTHLIGHLAQLIRPPGTFGMSRSICILNHSHVL
jgi:hypothetical protein